MEIDVQGNILVVDDVSDNIQVAVSILESDGYNFSYALSGHEAIEILKKKRFDLILLDIMMPVIDGFQLCKIIKNTPALKDVPIIFLTAKVDAASIEHGFKLGAVDYITKPFHPNELKARVKNQLELYSYRKALKSDNKQLHSEIDHVKQLYLTEMESAQNEMIHLLSSIIESDSCRLGTHVKRVAEISKQLAILEGNMSHEEIKTLYLAAPLHDMGKIFIDHNILQKPGKLTTDEFEVMKTHPALAKKVLSQSSRELIKAAAILAYEHHENYDGTGYPRGLKGEQIHIYGRIVAIADVLDALLEKRTYKEPWPFEKAAEYIISEKGKKFDPRLVSLFEENMEAFKEIAEGVSY
ncbi:MAG: HD domain-containing phosphohydrolase [Sulfurimonas sp.]